MDGSGASSAVDVCHAVVIPDPRGPDVWQTVEQAVMSDEDRIAVELVDTVIRDLFGVGLTLQRALSQVHGPAVDSVNEAIEGLDQVIRSIRDVVFGLSRSDPA